MVKAAELVSVAEARKSFADLIGRVHFGNERVDISRRAKPFVSLVTPEDRAFLEKAERLAKKKGFASREEMLGRLDELMLTED